MQRNFHPQRFAFQPPKSKPSQDERYQQTDASARGKGGRIPCCVNRQMRTDAQLKAGRNPLCQWLPSSSDSWKEMNTPQNHHGNCHYPALAVSALRSRTGKTKTRQPSQVEAEAIGKALGKILMNGDAP